MRCLLKGNTMRKTYLSLAMSRTWSAEMPVGDPYGGPAYGEKNGPAIALIGAYAGISTGMAIGASTLMGGLMIAGGVMSGLGAITGNKTLSQLGMVAGLAGGVGQFFSTGGFEAYSNAFSAGEGVSGGLSNMADQFTGNANFGVNASGMAPVVDAVPNAVTGLGGDATQNILSSAPNIGGADQAFGVRAANGGGLMTPAGTDSAAALAPPTPVTPVGNNLSLEGLGGTPQTQYPNSFNKLPLEGVTSKPGIMDGLGKFIKENSTASMLLANTVGQGVAGMATASAAEDKLKAEQPLVDAKTRESTASADILERRAAGAGAGTGNVGQFGSNTSKGAFGGLTYDQFVRQRADAWRAAYGATSPAQQGVPA